MQNILIIYDDLKNVYAKNNSFLDCLTLGLLN